MGTKATADQEARQRLRELRTRQDKDRAEQDERIRAAVASVVASGRRVTAADAALAQAQQDHGDAVAAAGRETAGAVRALRQEGLTVADIAQLTGLSAGEIRRVPKSDGGVAAAAPAAAAD